MRKVKVYKYKLKENSYNNAHKVFNYDAIFHQFGIGCTNTGDIFSAAIVELSNGTVKSVPIELIEFIKENVHEH